MGEYEDRYPEAYGRGDEPAPPAAGQDVRHPEPPARPTSDRPLFRRLGLAAAAETTPSWRHAPSAAGEPRLVEPTAAPMHTVKGDFRGLGPRGYVRSPARIYEDICDRLTDNPFIDATDIEVRVGGSEVTLVGSVDSATALRQAEEIAIEVVGVRHINNRLRVRSGGETRGTSPGDQINRAMRTGGQGR